MKCPNCGEKIDELMESCPKCKINFDEYEAKQARISNSQKVAEESSKTTMLKFINFTQIVGWIIIAFVNWGDSNALQGFICLFTGIVLFAFIKGFIDIIDLLDNINNKIKRQ